MKEFIAQQGGLVAMIVMVCMALNFGLSGLAKMLEIFKDKTATDVDNKAYAIINKISGVLLKVVEWGSGNKPNGSDQPKA